MDVFNKRHERIQDKMKSTHLVETRNSKNSRQKRQWKLKSKKTRKVGENFVIGATEPSQFMK